MSLYNNKIREVNNALTEAMKDIININKTKGGDEFDTLVYNTFYEHLKKLGFEDIDSKHWSKYYETYKAKTLKEDFDFKDVMPTNNLQDDCLIIDKPNGKQKWPDILIIYNKIGLPIEIKSAKDDGILWNSGIPKTERIYIFNCYGVKQTTAFLGNSVITEAEAKLLREMDLDSKLVCSFKNEQMKELSSNWSYYPRPMFNSSVKYFKDDEIRLAREQKVMDLILNNKWEN